MIYHPSDLCQKGKLLAMFGMKRLNQQQTMPGLQEQSVYGRLALCPIIAVVKTSGIEAILNLRAECYDLHDIRTAQGLEMKGLQHGCGQPRFPFRVEASSARPAGV